MKLSTLILVFLLSNLNVNLSHANAASDYHDALRIVVITADEGIHYAHGCAFYELRDLISEGVSNVPDTTKMLGTPLYEIRVLGKFGEKTVYIGDHRIKVEQGSALLSSATFDRVIELVENRKGQGVAKAKVETSIQRALGRVQDPTYVEERRCSTR